MSSPREVAIVLGRGDCSPHIPSRATGPAWRGGSAGLARRTRIYRVRIPRREGHSIHRVVSPAPGPCRRRQPHPRTHPSWPQRQGSRAAVGDPDRTTGANLRPSSLLLLRGNAGGMAPVLPCGRPGRRVGRCRRSNPSAVPGANTAWGGTRPPAAMRDWHQGAKSPPSRPGAARALRRPPAPGTPHTSSACSACAR